MAVYDKTQDDRLLRECLQGSRQAWEEFYARFADLVRCLIKRKPGLSPSDVEDLTQCVFLELASSLNRFVPGDSLNGFVCMITERTLVDEFRKATASKRKARTESIDSRDGEGNEAKTIAGETDLQDEQFEKAEDASRLRDALRNLDKKCRELIELRYLRDLPFQEVARIVGGSENTVTVQTRRCLDRLKSLCLERDRRRAVR